MLPKFSETNPAAVLARASGGSIPSVRPPPPQRELRTMPETMEISDAAKSGDGTTTNVGIKMTGTGVSGVMLLLPSS